MTVLSVNVNKVALLRNQRDLDIPSVTKAAEVCIAAGAQGITVHPRPDERHIRRSDVYALAEMLTVEFNIEGNPEDPFMDLVREVKPAQCTLVPDSPEQRTSDHGWDLAKDGEGLKPIIEELKGFGSRVSLFLDPVLEDVDRAAAVGADRIELYTEPYATAFARGAPEKELERYAAAAHRAAELGLGVNAGHDLNLSNLGPFCAAVPGLREVSIGHALTADALFLGLDEAVKSYVQVLETGQCALCVHRRAVPHPRDGNSYLRCALADSDTRFEKYPRLPMSECPGFVPESAGGEKKDAPGGGAG